MKLYVYCVGDREPVFPKALIGLEGKEVEFLRLHDFFIGASRFEDEFVPVTRENVLRHDAVVREAFAQATVLPFRFGTLVAEASLESYLRTKHRPLSERIEGLRNRVEMSVKIIWQNELEQQDVKPVLDRDLETGTAFLQSKREQLLGDEQRASDARRLAEWVHDRVSGMVVKEQTTVQPKQKLVLSASYLIDRSMEAELRETLSKMMAERPELHFLTSGPWPPYTFANIELEFETHFGVS